MVPSRKSNLSVTPRPKNPVATHLSNMKKSKTSNVFLPTFNPLGAYKQADGKKIDGKRVLVDYERGRTVKGWAPRRLGGGRGDTRKTKEPVIVR